MVRIAGNSICFREVVDHHFEICESLDVLAKAAAHATYEESFSSVWSSELKGYDKLLIRLGIPQPVAPCEFKQKVVKSRLMDLENPCSFRPLLAKRLGFYFDHCVVEKHVDSVVQRCLNIHDRVGHRFIASHLRAVTNHWVSSSRFGLKRAACHFCREHSPDRNDRVQHSLTCDVFIDLFCKFYKLNFFRPRLPLVLMFVQDGNTCNDDLAKVIMYYTHLCFLAFNKSRNGESLSQGMFSHIVTKQIGASKFARWVHNNLKSKKDDFILQ